MSKHLKLSNGFEIHAFVGDGFDGSSYIYYNGPSMEFKKPESIPIPRKDAQKVIKLLDWYEKKEMALRLSEGCIYVGMGERDKDCTIGDCSSPYQAIYFRGGLQRFLRGR